MGTLSASQSLALEKSEIAWVRQAGSLFGARPKQEEFVQTYISPNAVPLGVHLNSSVREKSKQLPSERRTKTRSFGGHCLPKRHLGRFSFGRKWEWAWRQGGATCGIQWCQVRVRINRFLLFFERLTFIFLLNINLCKNIFSCFKWYEGTYLGENQAMSVFLTHWKAVTSRGEPV